MKPSLPGLTAFLLLLIVVPVVSGDYWHGDFVDDSTRVFRRGAPVLSASRSGADTITILRRGTELTVTGSSGASELPDGTRTYWYEVSATDEGGRVSGWMPGTSLAMTSLDLGGDSLFMFTVTGYDSTREDFTGEALLLADGELRDSMAIRPISAAGPDSPYDYSVRGTLLDPSGLEGVTRLVQLSFIYEACGYLNRDLLVAVTDRGFVPGPLADSQFEAGLFTYTEDFILPSDSAGVRDQISVISDLQVLDEESGDVEEQERAVRVIRWTGREFADVNAPEGQ